MKPRTLGILMACGLVALAGGWYFGTAMTPGEQASIPGGKIAFPDLAPKLASATKIEITHQGAATVIEKTGKDWRVAQQHGYPAQEAKLRSLFTGLSELRLAEPRTNEASEYARLGVDDPDSKTSTANLVQVMDNGGQTLASLIVGHRKVSSQVNLPDDIYVRFPDQAQSWLAQGTLQPDHDPASWVDRNIMNIPHDRIASVMVQDKALVFGRLDGKFALTEPQDHPPLETFKVEGVARGLEMLTFQQVLPEQDASGQETGHTVFMTKDGLTVTVTVLHAGKTVWARFAVSGDDQAKAEADKLNARLKGWSYEIGAWKEASLAPTLDSLIAEKKVPTADTRPPAPAK